MQDTQLIVFCIAFVLGIVCGRIFNKHRNERKERIEYDVSVNAKEALHEIGVLSQRYDRLIDKMKTINSIVAGPRNGMN
jgi:hypothetical protein